MLSVCPTCMTPLRELHPSLLRSIVRVRCRALDRDPAREAVTHLRAPFTELTAVQLRKLIDILDPEYQEMRKQIALRGRSRSS